MILMMEIVLITQSQNLKFQDIRGAHQELLLRRQIITLIQMAVQGFMITSSDPQQKIKITSHRHLKNLRILQ